MDNKVRGYDGIDEKAIEDLSIPDPPSASGLAIIFLDEESHE